MATLETRRASVEDATAMARLAMQLGYDADAPAIRHRLSALRDDAEHGVFIAALDGETIVGWVHVVVRRQLTSPTFVEVTGLVVDTGHRRLGVGRALMQRCESWAESVDVHDVRVRTQDHRDGAKAFYTALGYEVAKTQNVFVRQLPRVDTTATPTLSD